MEVIYTDHNRIEQGVLQHFDIDFDSTNTKDFQITVGIDNNALKPSSFWYIEGTEYGGKIDQEKIITESMEIQYSGRNARGLLASKVIEPPSRSDYLILSGTLSEVIAQLISNAGYSDLFVADRNTIKVTNYKVDRYIYLYDGIVKLLATYGKIPKFTFKQGKIHIGVYESVDYSDANEYTQDDLQFTITKSYSNVNHLICLGQGELKDRTVIHLYTDEAGNISTKQTFLGEHEVVEVYENTNCESYDELMKEGISKLKELRNTDSFEVTVPDIDLKVGDIIGGLETNTNTYVAREIVNIIAKINDYKVELEYKVGEDDAARKSSSSGGSSSASSGGSVYNLPPATKETLGGIKVGNGLDIEEDGLLNVNTSYANQNAFSNVKVGNTTIAADTTTDTLTIAAGSNVKITPDATNNKVTIDATSGVVDITQADYNDLANKQDGVLYNITDADEYIKAENVEYGDSDVKTALDGLNSNLLHYPDYANGTLIQESFTSFTATYPCIFYVNVYAAFEGYDNSIYVNGLRVIRIRDYNASPNTNVYTIPLILSKGDVVACKEGYIFNGTVIPFTV